MSAAQAKRRKHRWVWLNALLAIGILAPALFGFATKFREFLLLLETDAEGAFTLMPVLNYLTVSLGFLLLFVAAILHGMFRNVEKPKYDMLAREQALDDAEEMGLPDLEGESPWHPRNRVRAHLDVEERHG